jgi:hypothetical protein
MTCLSFVLSLLPLRSPVQECLLSSAHLAYLAVGFDLLEALDFCGYRFRKSGEFP